MKLASSSMASAVTIALALGVHGLEVLQYNPPEDLCPYIGHPQYNCPEPIWCFDTWPHATKNYGTWADMDVEDWYYLRGGYGGVQAEGRSEEFVDPVIEDIEKRAEGDIMVTEVVNTEANNTCCAPTMECFNHIKNAKRAHDGKDTYIEDFDDWQMAVCCILDFTTPKYRCMAPDSVLPIRWMKPPICSNFETHYECKPLPGFEECLPEDFGGW